MLIDSQLLFVILYNIVFAIFGFFAFSGIFDLRKFIVVHKN
jgi:hypothetical protein